MLETKSLALLAEAINYLEQGFTQLPEYEPDINNNELKACLLTVAERLQNNFPYPHPFYIGQMLKSPHTIARLAYSLALYMNPNNHSFDGGRESSLMEKEAVREIAAMFDWQNYLGHLCSSGTFANLEALWIAKLINPNKKVVASTQAHYTHERISQVLNISFEKVSCNHLGQMNITALEKLLQTNTIGTVIATMGTTATGSVDSLVDILALRDKYHFRLHIDAAYGGYFILANNLSVNTKNAFDAITQADSIAIDPHKHGLQPYGCGCILFKDTQIGLYYKHDSPYTYFTSADLHLGEMSLECSRAGASAVALWATQQLLPLIGGGEFAHNLEKSRQAALNLLAKIKQDNRLITLIEPELDIVVWCCKAESATKISQLTQKVFEIAQLKNLHFAMVKLHRDLIEDYLPDIIWDEDNIVCFRCCLMKPEHLDWLDRIWTVFEESLSSLAVK